MCSLIIPLWSTDTCTVLYNLHETCKHYKLIMFCGVKCKICNTIKKSPLGYGIKELVTCLIYVSHWFKVDEYKERFKKCGAKRNSWSVIFLNATTLLGAGIRVTLTNTLKQIPTRHSVYSYLPLGFLKKIFYEKSKKTTLFVTLKSLLHHHLYDV